MTREGAEFATIEEALAEIRAGRMVVVVDDEDRENEGDLTLAAQFATPQAINFMATHGRGLICLAITPERAEALRLQPMVRNNQSRFGTAFTVSIEAREGVTTGISAADRARTIQVAIDPNSKPEDLVQPGHVFPLIARRRPRSSGANRSRGRPSSACRPHPSRSHLRNHERRWDHGPGSRFSEILPATRAEDDHRRRPHPLSPTDREAGAPSGLGTVAHPVRGLYGLWLLDPD